MTGALAVMAGSMGMGWRALCAGIGIWLFAGVPVGAAGRASWHHGESPYRAVFKVVQPANHRDAGIALAVPVCGLGSEEGLDLYAFDQDGNSLRLYPLGRGADNTAPALAKGGANTTEVYVYFGSKGRAPTTSKGFVPGLTLDVRTLPEGPAENWQQVEKLLAASRRLGLRFADKIEQSHNPVDSSDACILVFEGHLNITAAGTYTYMIVTDDAGYLFIDGQLLLARDGRHWANDAVRGEYRKEIALSPGPHSLRFVLVDFGGDLMAVLGRWISGKDKHVLGPDAFVHSARTCLVEVEAHHPNSPLPVFAYRLVSYMSYNGAQFTEVHFEAANGAESLWRFEDGAECKGASCTRILTGLATRGVACTQGRVTAKGRVQIHEAPPKALSLGDEAEYRRYTQLILGQNLRDLDPDVLRGYMTFLGYRTLNEDSIPVCEAILSNEAASEAVRMEAALELARCAARGQPELAEKGYRFLLRSKPNATWLEHAREAAEFALYRQRNFDWAEETIRRLAGQVQKGDKPVAELRFTLALQKGLETEARELLEALLSGRELGEKQRYSVVQGNALRERFYDLLAEDFVLEARDVVHEWGRISPIDWSNGNLALARARLWRRLGWQDGALGELDGAILLDALLPNLPDVELERGKVLAEAGDRKRANEVFLKIAKEYPNHPAAGVAKGLLR